MSKRTLDGFFSPPAKKPRSEPDNGLVDTIPAQDVLQLDTTNHTTYPWPIPYLPPHVSSEVELLVTAEGKAMNDQLHLDLLYFQPFIPKTIEKDLFNFLRANLFFYRVKYTIARFGKELQINTPRFTTVFGLDETSQFNPDLPAPGIVETSSPTKPVSPNKYKCKPRPIPECLDFLRRVTEANTNTQYNFCLVNYYADGNDSISYHSDDERFLGPDPAIASFSLGAKRDFLMKHKPLPANSAPDQEKAMAETKPIKLPLASGDMVLMKGTTQSNWLHSIPKRKGGDASQGRINITFRRAMVPGGTENYYRYNVGEGEVYKWDEKKQEMTPWK